MTSFSSQYSYYDSNTKVRKKVVFSARSIIFAVKENNMKLRLAIIALEIVLCLFSSPCLIAQNAIPSIEPKMEIEVEGVFETYEEYSGSAPVNAHFSINVDDLGSYIPHYEWRFYESGEEDSPFLVRYDENVDYVFTQSGTMCAKLYATLIQNNDTIEFEQDAPFILTISTSKLEVPNAFSPNGDGQNDIFKVKEGYQSIISFHGYIYNRWGKCLYEWTDINSGWDGTYRGTKVKDGVYFCLIKAKGADGINYEIKRDVNLLRGIGGESSSSSSTE